jgi:ribosome-binding protein aMBF1 (putative translation factor)
MTKAAPLTSWHAQRHANDGVRVFSREWRAHGTRDASGAQDANNIGPVPALSESQVADIRARYAAGVSASDLAHDYEVNRRTIYRYVEPRPPKQYEATRTTRKLTDDQMAEIRVADAHTLAAYADLAARYACSQTLIREVRRGQVAAAPSDDFVPACMTPDELAEWAGGREWFTNPGLHGSDHSRVRPLIACDDCLPLHAIEMRAESRCNGHPRGVEIDEDEPDVPARKERAMSTTFGAGEVAERLPVVVDAQVRRLVTRTQLEADNAWLVHRIVELEEACAEWARLCATLEAQVSHAFEPGYCHCCTCGKWLPERAFTVDRGKPSGRRSRCRACDREKRQAAPGYRKLLENKRLARLRHRAGGAA